MISTYSHKRMFITVYKPKIIAFFDKIVDKYGQITKLSTICSLNNNKIKSVGRVKLAKNISSYTHIHTDY